MVQLRGSLVHVHQQLVSLTHVTEVQVLQFLVGHYRSSRCVGDVCEYHVDGVNEYIVTHRRRGRLAGLRVKLIADITVGILIDLLAVRISHRHKRIVLLTLLAVERQVGQHTSLITTRALRRIGLDERLWQGLSEEAELVDVTRQPVASIDGDYIVLCIKLFVQCCTDERSTTADTTEAIGSEGGAQFLIDVDIGHVEATVHRHGEVVPLVVAPVARNLDGLTVRAEHQLLSLEGNVEDVLSTYLLLRTGTVADQYTTTVAVGLEPEHQRVVLILRAAQSVIRQLDTVVVILQTE